MDSRETQNLDIIITKITFGKDRYHEQEDMIHWCKTSLGKGGWQCSLVLGDNCWRVDSMFGTTQFWFKHERDYLLFCLRWL